MSDSENLVPGIYEQVLSKKLKSHIDKLLSINDKKAFLNKLDKAEASSVLSNYMASILKTCLDIVAEKAKKKMMQDPMTISYTVKLILLMI